MAEDVSLDGAVETSEGGPSSEERKGHLRGLRWGILWLEVHRQRDPLARGPVGTSMVESPVCDKANMPTFAASCISFVQ
nr:hypothetical protein CFP56_73824 [Quercus suber]